MISTAATNSVAMPLEPQRMWDRSEAWLILGALSGALIIAYLLLNDVSLFAINLQGNRGEPIATLAEMRNGVKYRTADVPIWQSAKRNMQIYKRDQIFTDASSRAEIKFNNNAGLVVDENSLIIVDLSEEKASLNLVRGSFTGKVNKDAGALNITVGNQTTQIVGANAQIALSKTKDEGLKLTVLEGNAKMLSGGQTVSLQKNQTGEVSKSERRIKVRTLPILLQSPRRDARIAVKTDVPTQFTWVENSKIERSYKFELAYDQEFTRIASRLETQGKGASLDNLPPGIYYWRVTATDPATQKSDISEERRVEVVRMRAPKLLTPPQDQVLTYRATAKTKEGAHVALEWLSDSEMFGVQLSNDESFRNIIWQEKTSDTRSLTQAIPQGRYYWRVRSMEAGNQTAWSETGIFVVKEIAGLEAPTNLRVANMVALERNPNTDRIELAWDAVTGAGQYDLEVSRDGKFARTGKDAMMRKRVKTPNFSWKSSSRASFYWRVRAVDESGFPHESSAEEFVELKKRRVPKPVPAMPIVNSNPSPLYASNAPTPAPTTPPGGSFGLTGPASATDQLPKISSISPEDVAPEVDPELPEEPKNEVPVSLLAPVLASPAQDGKLTYLDTPPEVPFQWEKVPNANAYRFQLAKNSDFSEIIMQQETVDPMYMQMIEKGQYYWRVQALGPANSQSEWSKASRLAMRHIPPMTSPEIIVPQNDTNITYRSELPDVAFRWEDVAKAEKYELQVAKDAGFTRNVVNETLTETRYIKKLEAGNYHWRVRAIEKSGRPGEWTPDTKLAVARSASNPSVGYPKKDEVVKVFSDKARKVKFAWDKIGDADNYKVVVSSDPSFNKIDFQEQTKNTEHEIEIPKDGKYYWYLEGRNTKENLAVRSEIESFNVETVDGSGASGQSSQRGRIYAGLSPMMYGYSSAGAEGSYAFSKNILTGMTLGGQFWITRPIGAEFRFTQGSATLTAAETGADNFLDSTITAREIGVYGLLRYGLGSIDSLLGTNLVGRVGFQQTTYAAPFPDLVNNTMALATTSSNHLSLGLGLDKDLSEKFMVTSNVDYGVAMGGQAPASSLGLNLELLQKISQSGFLLGYGYRYLATTGTYQVPENEAPSDLKSSSHALRFTLGKGF